MLFCLAVLPLVWASPSPRPAPAALPLAAPHPLPTASPVEHTPSKTRRDLRDSISSVLGSLGSSIPSYVAEGVADFFQNIPSGSAVQSSLGLDSSQLAALPTQVLNIP
jgi:hypothetical protein